MALHQKITGLGYDNIMIFPQGKFSEEAFEVLGLLGYKAAVNSGVYATNYQNTLSIRDVLNLTVKSASGLPLYRRRYPKDVFDFACDMLFEKPIIITQHHDDFREGYQPLEDFIKQLQRLEPELRWMPLNKLIDVSVWEKLDADGNLIQRKADTRPFVEPALLENEMPNLETLWQDNFSIAARRYLLEFRDEVIHTNPLLIKLMHGLLSLRKSNAQQQREI